MYIKIENHTGISCTNTSHADFNGSPLEYARDLIRTRSPLTYGDYIQIVKASNNQYQLYSMPGWNLLYTITGV